MVHQEKRHKKPLVNVTMCVVVLLYRRIHVRIDAGVDAGIHRRVQQTRTRSSFHGSNGSHILHRGMTTIVVVLKVGSVLKVRVVELLLRVMLQVQIQLRLEVVVIEKLGLVTNRGSGSYSWVAVAVHGLLNQSASVLRSLLLPANNSKVGLRRMVVSRLNHSQDPHLRVLLVVIEAAIEFVGVLLDFLGLVLLRRVQVGNQSVSTLTSLRVSDSLSLGSVFDGSSE